MLRFTKVIFNNQWNSSEEKIGTNFWNTLYICLAVHLFLCLSIYLYIVSGAIWTICNRHSYLYIFAMLCLLNSPLRQKIASAYFTTYISGLPFFFSQVGGFFCFTPRPYSQIHPPPVLQGGGGLGVDRTSPRSFRYAAVFRNDCAFSWKSLIFLRRWGILYGWWSCLTTVTSPTMVAILDFTKN